MVHARVTTAGESPEARRGTLPLGPTPIESTLEGSGPLSKVRTLPAVSKETNMETRTELFFLDDVPLDVRYTYSTTVLYDIEAAEIGSHDILHLLGDDSYQELWGLITARLWEPDEKDLEWGR
jgi:hypothetical protein